MNQSPLDTGGQLSTDSPDYTDVFEIGPIGHIRLPGSWLKGEERKHAVGRSNFVSYWHTDNNEVKFCFFYRGSRTSEEAAAAFKKVLAEKPHMLTSEEVDSLAETLWDKATGKHFTILNAKTKDLNGKRVLLVEGSYKDWPLYTTSIFVDSDKTGGVVQEVYYLAPKPDYQKYYLQASKAFASIFWRF